jgi:hypothetical protein
MATAGSRFVIARVRTWFDPRTIASFRGNGPLSPNPRVAFLVDGAGRRYGISAAGTLAYEEARGLTVPFSRALTPGDSYETALVFDPPEGVTRLFVGDPEGVERFLIGHENSFFHRKVFFGLAPPKAACLWRQPRQESRRGRASVSQDDAAPMDRVHGRDPRGQRPLLPHPLPRPASRVAAPAVPDRPGPPPRLSL